MYYTIFQNTIRQQVSSSTTGYTNQRSLNIQNVTFNILSIARKQIAMLQRKTIIHCLYVKIFILHKNTAIRLFCVIRHFFRFSVSRLQYGYIFLRVAVVLVGSANIVKTAINIYAFHK